MKIDGGIFSAAIRKAMLQKRGVEEGVADCRYYRSTTTGRTSVLCNSEEEWRFVPTNWIQP